MKSIFSSTLALTLLALGGCSSTGEIGSDTGKAGEIKQAIAYQPYFLKNQNSYCRVTAASGTAGYPTSRAGLIKCDQSSVNASVHSFMRIPSGSNVKFQVATGPDSVGLYVARTGSPSRMSGNMYVGQALTETNCGSGKFAYQEPGSSSWMAYDSTGIRTSAGSGCTSAASQWTWETNGSSIEQPTASGTSTNTNAPATYFSTLLSRAWKITMPADLFGSSSATDIYENELANWYHSNYFFADSSTRMVFKAPNEGITTSGSVNARSELREMLRNGDASITNMADARNSWSLASNLTGAAYPRIGGKLSATLHVDHVADSGCDTAHYGSFSVIVGQIHANALPNPTNGGFGNEPLKISYKKHPGHAKGSVYWTYQNNWAKGDPNRTITYRPVWGKVSSDNTDPGTAGVSLGEDFSYVVDVAGNVMTLTFTRAGAPTMTFTQDLSVPNNGTDNPDGWKYDSFYYKSGAYNQSNTVVDTSNTSAAACDGAGLTTAQQYAAGDYAQVTFSALTVGASGTTAATCTDGIKNQGESDVDCGITACSKCVTGKICTVGTNCASGVCTGGLCAAGAAVCGNGVKEGTEACDDGNTIVNNCTYGATSCTTCNTTCTGNVAGKIIKCGDTVVQTANGEQCDDGNTVNTDACSNTCKTPTCSDTIKNQSESDIDCGNLSGSTICSKCVTGKICTVGTNCASGVCTGGLCAAAAGGTTYQAGATNMTSSNCGNNGDGWWWMEDGASNTYMQWSSVAAGSSVTVRFINWGEPGPRLGLYINGVLKENRVAPVSTTGVDVVFNYPVTAGQSVKVQNTDMAEGFLIDYIKVQ